MEPLTRKKISRTLLRNHCKKWMIDMNARLERECMDAEMKTNIYIDLKIKRHELLETEVKSKKVKFDAIENLVQDMQNDNFSDIQQIKGRQQNLSDCWEKLLDKIRSQKEVLHGIRCFYMHVDDVEAIEVELNKLKECFATNIGESSKEEGLIDQHNSCLVTLERNQHTLSEIKEKCKQNIEIMQVDQQKEIEGRIAKVSLLLQDLICPGKSETLNESKTLSNFIDNVGGICSFLESKVEVVLQEYNTDCDSCVLEGHYKTLVAEIEVCQRQCVDLLEESEILMSSIKTSKDNDRCEVAKISDRMSKISRRSCQFWQ